MTRRPPLLLLPLLFFSTLRLAQAVCPNCFSPSSFTPLSGHGAGPGPNTGRVIRVCFGSSAQVDNNGNPTPGTTNPALWNGLNGTYGAINSWNNVKNGNSYSGYYIQYNCSSPDITIGFADHGAVPQDCATSGFPTGGSGQATITASDW